MAGSPEPDRVQRLALQLQGLVQGVGLRPYLYRLARQLALQGWVRNGVDGVELLLEGPTPALEHLIAALQHAAPPRCRIERLEPRWLPARGDLGAFTIKGGDGEGHASAWITPDLAICPACQAELADPGNRRHRYPFISCTDCGPRYSLLRQLPFEREHTSLAAFPLCPACRREYDDPDDRRFHAQTISCPHCGPQLRWQEPGSTAVIGHAEALAAAAQALQQGRIVALQGIGGFQLLVDPANAAAVAELRRRKGRPHKPLALLATPDWLERSCRLDPAERQLWRSPVAPILLLRPRPEAAEPQALAAAVAAGSPWLGVMRASSALQQLLLEVCGPVLVATSANRSGEPLAADAGVDAAYLAELADGVLHHDLPILNRVDDSVMRLAAQRPLVLRLGRGLAPLGLPHRHPGCALALGAQLKGSLALRGPAGVLLSPDLGDLSSSRGAQLLAATAASWLERHRLAPTTLHCDRHPGYASSQLAAELARELAVPLEPLQHHHAHLLAVMAEHGLSGEACGVAWDGAGLGDDDSLWGGEALAVSAQGYRRLARLRPFPLPGGERAMREPRRAALGLLLAAWGDDWPAAVPSGTRLQALQSFAPEQLQTLQQAVQHRFNSPLCSSVGRLFDAVAALLDLQACCSYEAQAAMALEGLASAAQARAATAIPHYRLPLRWQAEAALWEWDWQPLLEQLLHDRCRSRHPAAAIALGFHRALATAIAALAEQLGAAGHQRRWLLSGGCFQNALLLELSVAALQRQEIEVFWPQRLPCNDAGLAAGQLLSEPTVPITRSAPWAQRHVPRRTG